MLLPEKIGMLALAALLLIFGIVQLSRGCTPERQPLMPDPAIVDSLKQGQKDTLIIDKGKKSNRTTTKKPKKKNPVQSVKRDHLNEPVD